MWRLSPIPVQLFKNVFALKCTIFPVAIWIRVEILCNSADGFINCVSESAIVAKNGKRRDPSLTHKLIDAKTRIAIYGGKKVIRQLAIFDKEFGVLDTDEAIESFVLLMTEMREDSIGKRNYDISNEIKQIIFGTKL